MKRRLDRIEKRLPIKDKLWFVTSEEARETFSGRVIDKPTSDQLNALEGVIIIDDVPESDAE